MRAEYRLACWSIARILTFEIAGDRMLSTAVAIGSLMFLTRFYDNCDGFHTRKRVFEHLTPRPYLYLAPSFFPNRFDSVRP